MGGFIKYPENGELENLSLPSVNHPEAGYVCDNNEEEDQDILSDIRVPSIASNVICFNFIYLWLFLLSLIICFLLFIFFSYLCQQI